MSKQVMNDFALTRLELGDIQEILKTIIERHHGSRDGDDLIMGLDQLNDLIRSRLLPICEKRKGVVPAPGQA